MLPKVSRRALLAGFPALIALAQSKDPLIGTWHIDLGKSDFQPESTMLRRTLKIEAKSAGISVSQETVAQDGHSSYVEYTAAYDSKDVPISGSVLDTVALKHLNGNTVERTGKIRGQAVETATMSVSADGRTLTIVTKGSVNNTDYHSTQMFQRE
jgi:hypothetical protein